MNEHVQAYLKAKGYAINETALTIIGQADDWYRIRETESHTRVTVNGEKKKLARMGFAKRAAADDANLCEVIEINAGDAANETVMDVFSRSSFNTQYRKQLEETSAEGTTACYVRLDNADIMTDGTTQGGEIKLNYVSAPGFLPLTVENDDVIEAAFWGDSYQGTKKQTTLVICTRDPGTKRYKYETVVFEQDGKHDDAVEVELGEVKPFAVMHTAEVNSIDSMKGYGYPKVYGSIPVFLGLDTAFSVFFGDLDGAEAITFINELLCGFDDDGKPIPPNEAQKKRFVFLGEKLPQRDTLIQTEQPEVRVDSLRGAVEFLLAVMSTKFGFGSRKYKFDGTEIQTAAQYIGERQDMMQELNRQRYQAKQYIMGIVRAVVWFSNTYQGTALPELSDDDIKIEFDDSYIESKSDRLESYRQDVLSNIGGAHVRALYLKEKYNLTDEEAEAWAMQGDDEEPDEGA